jgi:hypothetical protein
MSSTPSSSSTPTGPTFSSRRKSCDACVRGKRRCGQELPMCARCTAKGIECQYAIPPQGNPPPNPTPTPQRDPLFQPTPSRQPSLSNEGSHDSFSMPSIEEGGELSFFGNDVPLFPADFAEFNDAVLVVDNMRSRPDFAFTTLPRDRVVYCVQQLKSYPKMLLTRGGTPFIHTEMYNEDIPMPQVIQEAYSICALYLSRTERTTNCILRIIESKANQIIASAISLTISEQLASLQALCLFQIIRLFDGDIRQRAMAEQQEHLLTDWATQLQHRTQSSPRSNSQSYNWFEWIFDESIRRTLIMAWMVHGVYMILKQGYCYYFEVVTSLPFTAQAALWNASSSYHWETAWREKKHFEIVGMQFEELLTLGSVEDVDELGLMMMATHLGMDQVREWAVRSGTQLVEP